MDRYEVMIQTEKNWLADRPIITADNHNPERITTLLKNEVTELIEAVGCFELVRSADNLKDIGQEIIDCIKYILSLSFIYNIDIFTEFMEKTAYNDVRFPAGDFQTGTYQEKYWGQKAVVKRDNMKEHFYEQGVGQETSAV